MECEQSTTITDRLRQLEVKGGADARLRDNLAGHLPSKLGRRVSNRSWEELGGNPSSDPTKKRKRKSAAKGWPDPRARPRELSGVPVTLLV